VSVRPDPAAAEFAAAVESIRAIRGRPDVVIHEIAAPEGLAPFAVALAADVMPGSHDEDSVLGVGRFVLLFDPAGSPEWDGRFRVISFAQAPMEVQIGEDPFLADVVWSWLTDALDELGAHYHAEAGTATKTISTGYGELAAHGVAAQVELRASWTPADADLAAHVEAWTDLVAMLAGMPPRYDAPPSVDSRRRP